MKPQGQVCALSRIAYDWEWRSEWALALLSLNEDVGLLLPVARHLDMDAIEWGVTPNLQKVKYASS